MNRFRLRTLIVLAVSLAAAFAIAACGGGDSGGGGDEDPQQVLDATFSNDQSVDSGVFDVSVNIESKGGSQAGTLEASLGGPFQSEEGKFPKFDIDADAKLDSAVQDFSGSAGLTSTGDSAFVNFQDTEYEVPADVFSQFTTTFTQLQAQNEDASGNSNLLSSLGIDPTTWLTDLKNEGDEDVEGTETVHISGSADVPKLLADIKTIAEKAPQTAGQTITPEQLSQFDALSGIVDSAQLDVYSGKDDNLLHKLQATLVLKPPASEGSPEEVDVDFSITLSDLNEPQDIAAPTGAKPLADLLSQFGVDSSSLGSLGAALGGSGAAGTTTTPQAGGAPAGPGASASQAYLECLQTADAAAAVQQCASLLQ